MKLATGKVTDPTQPDLTLTAIFWKIIAKKINYS